MSPAHVAVFIDHEQARIFHIDPDRIGEATIMVPTHEIHHKHPVGDDAQRFFQAVGRAIEGAEKLLVVGPSTAKVEFIQYLHDHENEHPFAPKIVAMETVEHPTDGQLVAYAQKYFKVTERLP